MKHKQKMGVLDGLRVLDLSVNSPGPFATMMLGDFGADVIQIVRPGFSSFGSTYAGDIADDPYITSRFQPFDTVMRNKRSLALDLKSASGKSIFTKLIESADILVEEFRPGKLAKLGFGYDDAFKINSSLIYCSLSGYGQRGPLRGHAGHDINYLGMTGALEMIRGGDNAPVNPQNILSDNGGGSMSAVTGILLALLHRQKTGNGQYIDASCTESVIYLMADIFSTALGGQRPSKEWRNTFLGRLPNYRAYRCSDDKWLSIGALEKHFCESLFDALGSPELMTLMDDRERWPELTQILEARFATAPRDEWVDRLSQLDSCVTPVLSPEEVAEHPQTQTMITDFEGIPQVDVAPRLSESPGGIRSKPAGPGQHSEEILTELGLTKDEITKLKQENVTQ